MNGVMKSSLILRTMAPLVLWLALPVSIIVLIQGHNNPGGGFVGGLVAAAGVIFYALGRGPEAARVIMRVPPATLCGAGILLAALSGLPALLDPSAAFLTHLWWMTDYGLGTALIFDIGVYLTVVGTATAIFLALIRG
ncbi:MAG: Na(+)/H(+) antiporter subunit B [Alphaproteobacteria bacterium]|nr:Na(+)/H(+) antiporter subunit B [Alphaproteobacteria bacterium]MBU0799209.1 Na(+)/H(+) antiporter subunit B [Alphaproteobacteria bacterium]MBU0887540.1 Na(+)/H(+) antiporter subunit B [Alphaproteobacteria bacterium]MBU1814777.1 Na(+)/H(+) antiporter subunit B [Alphaproteobacteria bacterium]MBU2089682.1 Na(+)/H(+) antiporter subunit B [Alphaproteobacteria bacterium]